MKRDNDEITKSTSSNDNANANVIKKPKKSSKMNLLQMIIEAIRSEKKPDGSSRIFIKKYLNEKFNYTKENLIKKALQNGVASNHLIANKASFKVNGDEEYEVPEEERIKIEEKMIGDNDGLIVQNGDTVFIDYIGSYIGSRLINNDNNDNNANGSSSYYKQFEKGKKFEFIVGNKDVIKGMDMGVLGMKLNGKRNVYIPSKLGYGKKGAGPDLPPNSDLLFQITVKQIIR